MMAVKSVNDKLGMWGERGRGGSRGVLKVLTGRSWSLSLSWLQLECSQGKMAHWSCSLTWFRTKADVSSM